MSRITKYSNLSYAELNQEKRSLQRKYNFLNGLRKALIVSEITLPTIITTALTLTGAKAIFNASPLLENDKATYEITSEEFDSKGALYKTKDVGVYAMAGNPSKKSSLITAEYYQPWIKDGDSYFRNVSEYQLENNNQILSILKKSVDELTEEDLKSLNFEKTKEYQQEGFNLSEEELKEDSYIKINSKYVSSIIYTKETIGNNIIEIGTMGFIIAFMVFVEYGVNAFICAGIDADPKKRRITEMLEDKECFVYNDITEIQHILKNANNRTNKKVN